MAVGSNGHGTISPSAGLEKLPVGRPAPVPPAGRKLRKSMQLSPAQARELARRSHDARRANELRQELLRMDTTLDGPLPPDHPFATYADLAREFRAAHTGTLADTVGGGVCGPAPAALVATAAYQLACSRWLLDSGTRTGDTAAAHLGSRLADSSRQNLLAAHELCAREAVARHKMGQQRTEVGSLLTQGARVEEGDDNGDG